MLVSPTPNTQPVSPLIVPGFMAPFARRVQGMARKIQGLANPQTDNSGVLDVQNLNDQLKIALGKGWNVAQFNLGSLPIYFIYQNTGVLAINGTGYNIATGNLQIQQIDGVTVYVTYGTVQLFDQTAPASWGPNVPTVSGTSLHVTPPFADVAITISAQTYIYVHGNVTTGVVKIEHGASVPTDGYPDFYYSLGVVNYASGAITTIISNKFTPNNLLGWWAAPSNAGMLWLALP